MLVLAALMAAEKNLSGGRRLSAPLGGNVATGFSGTDSFTYRMSDDANNLAEAVVAINVIGTAETAAADYFMG